MIVYPFRDLTGVKGFASLSASITDEIVGQIARFREITVIAENNPSRNGEGQAPTSLSSYTLDGSVRLEDNRLRVTARLIDRLDGTVAWVDSFERQMEPSTRFDIENDVADEIASAVAQPYGVVFQEDALKAMDASDSASAYACALSYYGYRMDQNARSSATTEQCLQENVRKYPGYATGWALLSLAYVDEYRFRYNPHSRDELLNKAAEAAKKATELDPLNVRAMQADMLVHFFRGERKAAFAIGEKAFAINPNDAEFVSEYGLRLAMSGQWTKGCGLVESLLDRNPGPDRFLHSGMAICAYMRRDYAAAENWAKRSSFRDNPIYHLFLAAIYGQQGKLVEAKEEHSWLQESAPDYLRGARKEVAQRFSLASDQEHVIDGLWKAGIEILIDGFPGVPVAAVSLGNSAE